MCQAPDNKRGIVLALYSTICITSGANIFAFVLFIYRVINQELLFNVNELLLSPNQIVVFFMIVFFEKGRQRIQKTNFLKLYHFCSL